DNFWVSFKNGIISPEHFFNFLDLQAKKENKILATPARVQWEVTKRCNLHCRHCYINSIVQPISNELSTVECLDAIEQMKECNVVYVEIQGGEPFMRDDLMRILHKMKELGIPFRIFTNGTLLSPEIAGALNKVMNPLTDLIQISLDGPDSDINDIIRSKGSFTKIVEGICNCRDAGVKFSVNTTLCDINVDYLCETYKLVSSLSGPYAYTFFTLMNAGRGKDMQFNNVEKGIEEAIRLKHLEKRLHGPRVSGFVGYIQHLTGYIEAMREVFGPNPTVIDRNMAARSSIDIDSNGDVYPSAYFQVSEMRGGNIREQRLRKVWRTPKWEDVRKNWPLSHTKCDYCDRREYCNRGNRAITYQAFRRLDLPDLQCKYVPPVIHGQGNE
ncbi:radical SAM protein, partial [Dehalococcoidia bacterium]|nr:radical SAM protein [Dehalococcoidia bacterium]